MTRRCRDVDEPVRAGRSDPRTDRGCAATCSAEPSSPARAPPPPAGPSLGASPTPCLRDFPLDALSRKVTLDERLRYTGISTDGARLDARVTSDNAVVGTIKPAGGKWISFKVHNLALASPADRAAHGLSEDYTKYAANSQVPGTYVAVIAPGGSHWFGRS